ncbi:MAG: gamma-glutamylcyclotransferase [Gemmatimonadota bacterium]
MANLLAYGSLMWDNVLATHEGEPVRVDGFRRDFVGRSTTRWGDPSHPCPQIGLVPGEGCSAVLFHVPRFRRGKLYRSLSRRERARPRKVPVLRQGERLSADAFVPPAEGRWADRGELLEAIRRARGSVGTGPEYIRTLVHALELWGIEDPFIEEIWEDVRC